MNLAPAERRGQPGFAPSPVAVERLPWARLYDPNSRIVLVLPWLLFTLLVAWTMRAQIAGLVIDDPDDAMRLLEVRAWLAGQSWWDVTNYRAGGVGGYAMHWSRLADVPLAALILLFDIVLPRAQAEIAAAALLPPLQLLGVLFLLRGTLRCLGFKGAEANIVLLVVPLLPLVAGNMVPLKVDHHSWQVVIALGILRLVVDRRAPLAKAVLAGAAAAVLVAISVEGLPFVAAVCAVYAAAYLRDGRDPALAGFLGGLAGVSLALFLVTQPYASWTHPWPDAVGWPHLLGFALAAIAAFTASRLRRPPVGALRAVLVAMVAVAGAAPVLLVFGRYGVDPFAALDPLIRSYWLDGIEEVRPIARLQPETAAMVGWTALLYVLALVTRGRKLLAREHARGWFCVFALAGAMLLLSLLMYRVALLTQALMAPLLAAMLYGALRVASRLPNAVFRVAATLAALLLLSPTAGSLAGKLLVKTERAEGTVRARGSSEIVARECDFSHLANLPRGRIFASIDVGPALLLRTSHSVVAAGYHRNQKPMLQVLRGFTGGDAAARAQIAAARADYVMICRNTPDTRFYAQGSPRGLAARLLADDAPEWLLPEPGFDQGSLRVWRVR